MDRASGQIRNKSLLGAAATCYIITLAGHDGARRVLEKEALTMESVGVVEKGVITYKKIIHKPHIVLKGDASEKTKRSARTFRKAETSCMMSRAIQGNVTVEQLW